jgi:hypothetical protein
MGIWFIIWKRIKIKGYNELLDENLSPLSNVLIAILACDLLMFIHEELSWNWWTLGQNRIFLHYSAKQIMNQCKRFMHRCKIALELSFLKLSCFEPVQNFLSRCKFASDFRTFLFVPVQESGKWILNRYKGWMTWCIIYNLKLFLTSF